MLKKNCYLIALLILVGFAACGPYKAPLFEEIGPNQTAFLVPLEGDTKGTQSKFMSVDYLEKAKVAAKRVEIPLRRVETGRSWASFKYVPTMRLILVDRAPVTREWINVEEKGTDVKDDALPVETRESIGFGVGLTITASIHEEDAAKYLYHFGTVSLSDVLDKNVRGHLLASMSYDFGKLTLDECRKQKGDIIKKAITASTAFFAERGITFDAAGNSGGLVFSKEIQDEIDKTFVAEQNVTRQDNLRQAQLKINDKEKSIADTKLYQAQKLAQAQQATVAMVDLEIRKMQAQALVNFSEGLRDGKTQLPANILPANSPLLMNLGEQKK